MVADGRTEKKPHADPYVSGSQVNSAGETRTCTQTAKLYRCGPRNQRALINCVIPTSIRDVTTILARASGVTAHQGNVSPQLQQSHGPGISSQSGRSLHRQSWQCRWLPTWHDGPEPRLEAARREQEERFEWIYECDYNRNGDHYQDGFESLAKKCHERLESGSRGVRDFLGA